MMLNPNRIAEKALEQAKPAVAYCGDCFAAIPEGWGGIFCPPCQNNADKGKIGFSKGDKPEEACK